MAVTGMYVRSEQITVFAMVHCTLVLVVHAHASWSGCPASPSSGWKLFIELIKPFRCRMCYGEV